MANFEAKAKYSTDRFIALGNDINTFTKSLDPYLTLAQEGLDVDTERLQGEITKLNEQIARFVLGLCIRISSDTL
jgi:hypothetical protein